MVIQILLVDLCLVRSSIHGTEIQNINSEQLLSWFLAGTDEWEQVETFVEELWFMRNVWCNCAIYDMNIHCSVYVSICQIHNSVGI